MKGDAGVIARHAGTVLVGQLAVMAYGVVDTMAAGRFSEQALAAFAVGAASYVTVFVALNGLLQALLPTWAELHGARQPLALGRSVRQALYLAGAAVLVGTAGLLFPGPLLTWAGVPPQLQGDVRAYLGVLVLALPPTLCFRMFSTLNQSLGRPRLVTGLQLASLGLKVPLTIWFVFGGLGLPALGAVGCAWATVLVQWSLLATALWLVRTQPLYEPLELWRKVEPPDWRALGRFARLGIPAGLALWVEVTSFTMMALFIARQGTLASAAHQVAANSAAVMYMTPLSVAIATSARISYWLGAGDPQRARRCIRIGFSLGLGLAVLQSTLVLLNRDAIAALYASSAAVAAFAASLLGWSALFHLGDAMQALCVHMLRCYRVAVAPLLAYCVLLWGVGLAGGFMLAYRGLGPLAPLQTPSAFWMASCTALALLGLILPLILRRAARAAQPAQPA